MNDNLLTIFTPVYNRARNIRDLYESLVGQTNQYFTWIIVDDGSQDDIDTTVNSFISEKKLNIKYYKQKNQGKHVAHNNGVKCCDTSFFTCVDSDDILVDHAVEIIYEFIEKNKSAICQDKIGGIVAYKGYSKNEKVGEYPIEIAQPHSLSDLYNNGMTGDTMLIFKTDVIRKYPFPVFTGERFLRESIAYDSIDENYKYMILGEILYLCEYLDDGLSKNAPRLEMESPLGAALFRYHEAEKAKKHISRVRNLIAYVFFSRKGNNTKECRKKLGIRYPFYWIMSFVGYIWYKKYF